MNWIFVLIACLFIYSQGYAQKKPDKVKPYKVWVKLTDGSREKGFLYRASEQGLTINQGKTLEENFLITIAPDRIAFLKIRRKGAVGKGIGFGALSGVLVGGVGSYLSDDNEEGKGDWSGPTAVVWGFGGAGIGALIGSGKKHIVINGDLGNYLTQLNSLVNYDLIPDN